MSHENQIKEMSERGLSCAEAAREIGISRQRVHQLAKSIGVTFPDKRRLPRQFAAPAPKSRVITGGVETLINHTVAGTICELLTAADLMARGYQVFLPVIASKGHDIIASKDGRLITVEVRAASRRADCGLSFGKKPDCMSDHYALVVTGEPVIYEPPLP